RRCLPVVQRFPKCETVKTRSDIHAMFALEKRRQAAAHQSHQRFHPVSENISEAVADQPYSPATIYCGNEDGDAVVLLHDARFLVCRSENRINEEMTVRELLRYQNASSTQAPQCIERFTSAISTALLLLPEYLWFGRQQIRAMRRSTIHATQSLPR